MGSDCRSLAGSSARAGRLVEHPCHRADPSAGPEIPDLPEGDRELSTPEITDAGSRVMQILVLFLSS